MPFWNNIFGKEPTGTAARSPPDIKHQDSVLSVRRGSLLQPSPLSIPPPGSEPVSKSLKHVAKTHNLWTLPLLSMFQSDTKKVGRSWIFSYRFPNTHEWAVYYLPPVTKHSVSITRHPLIQNRGLNLFRSFGEVVDDEVALMRQFAVQGMSTGYQLTALVRRISKPCV